MSDATTAVSDALAAVMAAQWLRVSRAWSASRRGDAAALRRARIASRRLREVLAIVHRTDATRQSARARREVRRITRALGPSREIEVALDRFGEATRHHGWPEARVLPVRRHLVKQQLARRAVLAEWMAEVDLRVLGRRLSAVAADLAATSSMAVEQALAARVMRRAREARNAARRCGTLYAPERLHAVRIAVKKLRYALELGALIGHSDFEPIVASLTKLQKRLGALHDVQVLQSEAQALATGRGISARAAGELVSDALEKDCRALHGKVVADVAGLDMPLAEIRRVVANATGEPRRVMLPIGEVSPAIRRRVVG